MATETPINLIPNISVNGTGGALGSTLFGGYIYSLDYNVRMGNEGSSTVTISVISIDGEYSITKDDLRLDRVYNILIGDTINLAMYLKSYRKTESSSGRLLELQFVDGSFALDRVYVGLHKKHGYNPDAGGGGTFTMIADSLASCIIIVGHEKTPCDRNYDGTVDDVQDLIDPCHPCSGGGDLTDAQLMQVNCKLQFKYDILQVEYNFTELINKLVAFGFVLDGAVDPNPTYFASYEGLLREVLSSWCADFGWSFYWENNVIHFKDLRTVINVNASIDEFCPNVVSDEEEYTLEGTTQGAVITNYSRPGRGKNEHRCQDARWFNIPVYDQNRYNGTPLAITKEINLDAIPWAMYGPELRCLYYWFSKYQLGNGNVYAGLGLQELGITILSNPLYKTFGQFLPEGTSDPFSVLQLSSLPKDANGNIQSFLDSTTSVPSDLQAVKDGINGDELYKACFSLLSPEDQWKAATDIDNKYFVLVFHEEGLEQQIAQREASFGSEFFGKYYIFSPDYENLYPDFFEFNNYINQSPCGGNELKDDGKLTYKCINSENNSAQGTANFQYYPNPNPSLPDKLATLPFARFLAMYSDSNSAFTWSTSDRNMRLVVFSKSGDEWSPTPGASAPDYDPSSIWVPKDAINNRNLVGQAFSYYPKEIPLAITEQGQSVMQLFTDRGLIPAGIYDKSSVKLIMGTISNSFQTGRVIGYSPKTNPQRSFDGRLLNPDDDPVDWVYQYPQLKCYPVGNWSGQCYYYYMNTPTTTFSCYSPTLDNYAAIIEKDKAVAAHLDKAETVMRSGACPGPQALTLNINTRDVTDQTLKDITKLPQSSTCLFDIGAIGLLHTDYAKNLNLTLNVPLVKKTFTVGGIAIQGPPPTIGDGLLDLKISLNDSGVTTTYSFGTTKMILPRKPEIYQKELALQLNKFITDMLGKPASYSGGGGSGTPGAGISDVSGSSGTSGGWITPPGTSGSGWSGGAPPPPSPGTGGSGWSGTTGGPPPSSGWV